MKNEARKEYRGKDTDVKRGLTKDKRDWINSVAHEAEDVNKVGMVKSKERRLLTKEGEIKARLQEHFMGVLNRLVPEAVAEVDETNVANGSIVIREITREYIKSALGDIKKVKRQV